MEPDEGGDAACWVHRVCGECGRLAERPGPRCEACGAELPGDDD